MGEKRWRIIENEWNIKAAPWTDAIGIEEVDDTLTVPSIVCWFTRGGDAEANAHQIVRLHNYTVAAGGMRGLYWQSWGRRDA